MIIRELIVEPDREEHIARHNVTLSEVEEVAFGTYFPRRAKGGWYLVIGQTDAGRYLSIVVAPRGPGIYALVTAREAEPGERQGYHRHRGMRR